MNAAVQTPAVPPAPTGANVMIVGCKLPHGFKMEIGRPNSPGYETFTLKGPSAKNVLVIEGFAINRIPESFWKKWLEFSVQVVDPDNKGKKLTVWPNKTLPALQRGFIYAHPEQESVEAFALERSAERTGLEPIDPDKPGPGLKKFDKND